MPNVISELYVAIQIENRFVGFLKIQSNDFEILMSE